MGSCSSHLTLLARQARHPVRTRPRYGTFMSRMALRGTGDVRETRRHPPLVAVLASLARTSVFRKHEFGLSEDEAR